MTSLEQRTHTKQGRGQNTKATKLRERARNIVENEPTPEHDYANAGFTELRNQATQLFWYSGKRIPQYLDSSDYNKHNLEDWITDARMRRDLEQLSLAKEEILEKYELEFDVHYVRDVDQRYKELQDKPVEVVKRFQQYNQSATKTLCEKLFDDSRQRKANNHAITRTLNEHYTRAP